MELKSGQRFRILKPGVAFDNSGRIFEIVNSNSPTYPLSWKWIEDKKTYEDVRKSGILRIDYIEEGLRDGGLELLSETPEFDGTVSRLAEVE